MVKIFEILHEQPVLFLFLLIGIGMAFGKVKIKGIGLGAAAVLFFAIVMAAWAQSFGIELQVTKQLGTLGLTLFTFAIGINSGASFFHNLKTAVGPILTMVAFYGIAATLGLYVGKAMGMEVPPHRRYFRGCGHEHPGTCCGRRGQSATPRRRPSVTRSRTSSASSACSPPRWPPCTTAATTRMPPLPCRTARSASSATITPSSVTSTRSSARRSPSLVCAVARPARSPAPRCPTPSIPGDLVTVVGPRELVARAATELGHASSHSLMQDRSYLDFRRMTISNPKVAGRTVASLGLAKEFSATISRVRRGDVDMVAEPGLVLQEGDRVRVVAPTSKMAEITKFFGDSSHGLTDLNPIALGLGMALGIAIGELPILTPSGEYFSIGSAAGTLIVGLIFGRIGRIGPIATALPFTTCQVMCRTRPAHLPRPGRREGRRPDPQGLHVGRLGQHLHPRRHHDVDNGYRPVRHHAVGVQDGRHEARGPPRRRADAARGPRLRERPHERRSARGAGLRPGCTRSRWSERSSLRRYWAACNQTLAAGDLHTTQ